MSSTCCFVLGVRKTFPLGHILIQLVAISKFQYGKLLFKILQNPACSKFKSTLLSLAFRILAELFPPRLRVSDGKAFRGQANNE